MYKTSTYARRALMLFLISLLWIFDSRAQTKKISVAQAVTRIAKQYNVKFAYEHKIVAGKTTEESNINAPSLDEALKKVLYANNLVFLYVSEKQYTIVSRDTYQEQQAIQKVTQSQADNVFISGVVLDDTGLPLPGASVKSNSSNISTRTNEKGEFGFSVLSPVQSISVSFIGFETAVVNVSARISGLRVTMHQSASRVLDEVQIVSNGYQTIGKERATGAAITIDEKQLKTVPTANIISRLESMIPGVKVNLQNSGNSFVYRNTLIGINSGTRTLGTADYGVSIRGTSTFSGESFPLVVVDGAISDIDISTLNPNDIQNITFLKDAAAASIWGVRAANGVIVINTKKGKQGQSPQVSFSANASVSNAPDLGYLKLMSSAQAIQYEQELVNKNVITMPSVTTVMGQNVAPVTDLTFKLKAGQITQQSYDALISEYSTRDIRGQISDYILKPSTSQQYNFSIRGGGSQSSYYYSASYSKEDPYTKGVNGNRLTVALNNTFNLFGKATLSTNVRGAFMRYNNNGIALNQFFRPSSSTYMPYEQLVDDKGNRVNRSISYYSGWLNSLYGKGFLDWGYNPLNEMDNSDNSQKDNNYTVNLDLKIPLLKNLTANGFFSNEAGFSNSRVFYNEASYYYRNLVNQYTPNPTTGVAKNSIGLSPETGGMLNSINSTVNNYTVRGQLNYDGEIAKDHRLTALAGIEIRQTKMGQGSSLLYGYNMQTGIARPVDFNTPYETLSGYSQALSGYPSQADKTRRYLSYYGNAAYTYKAKYTLSGSIRYDDYNNFGVDRSYRATPLFSFGAKWNAKQESFLQQVSFIDNLSLRATYGVNGNILTTVYPFTYLSIGSPDGLTGLPTSSIISPANPEVRWEKTYVTNLGMDFSLFGNALSGSVDVYKKKGRDLFYTFPVNGTYGQINLTRNTAGMDGKGVDIGLNGRMYSSKDIDVFARFNYAYNTDVVNDSRFVPTSSFYSSPFYGSRLDGYASNKAFAFRNAGLDANGMTQIYDKDGQIVPVSKNVSSLEDLKYVGRTTPGHFGAFTPSIRYKDFTLLAVATYQFGGVFLKPTVSSYPSARTGVTYDLSADVAKRWQASGDEANTVVPGVVGVYAPLSLNRYMQSDINVLKSDYIRLREFSLTYNIPVVNMQKYIKSANVGFNVRNLGLLWRANKEGIDPDFAIPLNSNTLALPEAVSYNFTLNVNF